MKESLNTNRPIQNAPGDSGDSLSGALEELVSGAPGRAGTAVGAVGLGKLRADGSEPCPEIGEWIRLATEELPVVEKDKLLLHAAVCSECLMRMRESQAVLSGDAQPAESAALAECASLTPEWQHRLAVELAQSECGRPQRTLSPIFAWASGAMAAALVALVAVAMWQRHENAPEKLLAEASSDFRSSELRVPGARFGVVAPPRHLRGGASDHEPAPLLAARAQIERKLEKAPADPYWLQLEARAEVLEERYDDAVDILDRLLAAGPATASLLVDDGSAYFLRGAATGSENDRATALDYLRRADELAPDDPVVLFNEALMMEDRGQVMNAVETWNRYLKFERDSGWQGEGRRRLALLEEKLNRLKTHESRMERYLATPETMRALAADEGKLAVVDEELSMLWLPRLLDSAFPPPVDRSRGSPCGEDCMAARALLHSLAASLERNHQDFWLTHFLPSASSPTNQQFTQAARTLGEAVDADILGDFDTALERSGQARALFAKQHNAAGEDRSALEHVYALQRRFKFARCYKEATLLLSGDPRFAWIRIQAITERAVCDAGPGSAQENGRSFQNALRMAEDRHYTLLALRGRNMLDGNAVESGDVEGAWRGDLATVRFFYSGDYSPYRLFTTLSGLAMAEDATPRVQHALLLKQEALGVLELTKSRELIPPMRLEVAEAAIRAGAPVVAQEQMRRAQSELDEAGGGKSIEGFLAEDEIAMANLYIGRGELTAAGAALDSAHGRMAGDDDFLHRRTYAAARGELEFARGRGDAVEPMLRAAILEAERQASLVGVQNTAIARQNRELYAVLAGVWLAQGRRGDDVLALWERYRLRILGKPVPACPDHGLACLDTQLAKALANLGDDRVMGQVVLLDRTLLFRAGPGGVTWSTAQVGREELLATAARLERTAKSPATSQSSVDAVARRVGAELFSGLREPRGVEGSLLLEPDPLLGNVPWPAVEMGDQPIGLLFSMEEVPSLLLRRATPIAAGSPGRALVVGASTAAGQSEPLPEVLSEARAVAGFEAHPYLLLASQATRTQVAAHIKQASLLHFAGHAMRFDGETRLLLARTGVAGETPYIDSALLRRVPPEAARLVVFSACSTGKREEGWNHDMGDIVDTLASLGVPEVVATRWQIDSASAVPMMDAFYRGLSSGLSVPRALTAARHSLTRDARYRHPYYWAAYYASGVGKPDLREVFHGSSN